MSEIWKLVWRRLVAPTTPAAAFAAAAVAAAAAAAAVRCSCPSLLLLLFLMPKSEWRLFIPVQEAEPPHMDETGLIDLFQDVAAAERLDVYLKANADVGIKRRVSQAWGFLLLHG